MIPYVTEEYVAQLMDVWDFLGGTKGVQHHIYWDSRNAFFFMISRIMFHYPKGKAGY